MYAIKTLPLSVGFISGDVSTPRWKEFDALIVGGQTIAQDKSIPHYD